MEKNNLWKIQKYKNKGEICLVQLFNISYREMLLKGIFLIGLFQGIVTMLIPSIPVVYICDLLIILFLLLLLKKPIYQRQNIICLWFFVIAFLGVGILGIVINGGKLIYFLWGFRNYFRFFMFFFFCVYFLKEKDVAWCMKVLEWSFYPHIILVLFQYLLGYRQDFLSGIWGVEAGGNGGLNLYLVGLTCVFLRKFYRKEISLVKYLLFLACICTNAAVSELKFLFVEIAILTVLYFVICQFSIKMLKMILCLGLIMLLGINLFIIVFPNYANYFSISNLYSEIVNSRHYASADDLGRSTIFSTLTPILKNWAGRGAIIWGLGLGNGDCSTAFPILNSAFYMSYGYLHYIWFSLGYLFVETGYIGVILYVMFFVMIFVMSLCRFKLWDSDEYLLTTLFSIACLMIMVYNNSLRGNTAYVGWFLLSVPFVKKSCVQINKNV